MVPMTRVNILAADADSNTQMFLFLLDVALAASDSNFEFLVRGRCFFAALFFD